MKIRILFNLLDDAQHIADVFAKVETVEQMVSLLERLKKKEIATQLLEEVQSLKLSVEAAYSSTLEMGGTLNDDQPTDDLEGDDVDDFLGDLGEGYDEASSEDGNPTSDNVGENQNSKDEKIQGS